MARPKGARDGDYEEKRGALVRRMMLRLMRRETARPSLRELAVVAGVSVPTLRHYFGGRSEVVAAIFEAFLKLGERRLLMVAEAPAPFADSVREFAHSFLVGMRRAGPVRLGDAFAVGLAEGLLDPALGPSALRYLVDPAQQALQRRLDEHVARGEMIETNTRAASLMLLSPILIAALHQDQMGGSECNPLDLESALSEITDAFIRAYIRPSQRRSAARARTD